MSNNLEDDIRAVLAGMDNREQEQDITQTQPEDIQDIYVLIVREQEEAEDHIQVVDSTPIDTTQPAPVTLQHDSFLSAYLFVCFALLLILATLTFQLYCIQNPLIATVTIIPTSQQVTLNGTMQLGRVLPPLTISQSQTALATGKGHQDARAASGTVIFYNGLFTQQFIASGTVYTGQDGRAIVTTQDATIPPGSPSTGYGTATIPAQALQAGRNGNIQNGDVSITINNGLLVKNNQFTGGQDERTYTIVTHNDIHSISTLLKTTITQSITGAMHGQLQPNEQLRLLPCSPIVTSNYQPGAEATQVKVTVSQTCSAVVYNNQELQTKATSFLATQAQHKTGTGYSLFGTVQVRVTQASIANIPPHLVFLSFHASGTWIYGISSTAQEQIKHLIAGKSTQQAKKVLASWPEIKHEIIRFSGFGDVTKLAKQTKNIHISLIVV